MSTKIVLNRRWVMCVGRNGSVIVRDGNVKRTRREAQADFVEAMPVYSTDTKEEADDLITLRCRRARDGSGTYTLNQGAVAAEDLEKIGAMFAEDHARDQSRKAQSA